MTTTASRGWMPGVQRADASGQGYPHIPAGTMKPDSAIMHTIEGWQHVMANPHWRRNSYQFTIRLDGLKMQHVSIYTPAWHSGNVDRPTWKLYRPGVNPNDHTVAISAEGAARADANPHGLPLAWTEPQIVSAIEILEWVRDETGIAFDEDTLTEHAQINTVTRTDPGPRWPKSRVLVALRPKGGRVTNAYIVQPGDTLGAIARRPGFPTQAQIAQWNGITNPDLIKIGQVLRLDPNAVPAAAATAAELADLELIEQRAKRVRERLTAR
jgi:hypothetical protein